MSFQQLNNGKPMGEIDLVAEVNGNELINCMVHAPLTPYE